VAGIALLAEVLVALLWKSDRLEHASSIGPVFGSPAEIGRLFLTDHLLAFEITSIVLLVAAVGGVVLGIQARDHADLGEAE
jgi:NADH:ubiquinone oxidoreductase subunit 6 (subunit J)